MSISGLVRRLVKGTALTAAEHDANLDAIEDAVDGKVESTTVTAIVAMTDAQYAAVSPKVATTLYVITNAIAETPAIYLGSVPIAMSQA
jgi:hypothetical protein